ncbi:MAG: MFS transporter [Negativicutes bacterium]|nr:MFS transporter [Negativicutes bacterium]
MSVQNVGTQPANAVPEKPTKQRFIMAAILFISIMIAYLDRVNTSVLAANDSFLLDMAIKGQPIKIGMMMSSFLAAYGVAGVILSPLGDLWGARKAMLAAVSFWCISLFVGGIAGGFTMLIASRIILGIGEGWYYPLQSTVIKNWFPPQERGRANAAWVIGQSAAPAIAMPFFAYIIGTYGWRDSFHLATVLTLIPLILLWFFLTDTPQQNKKVNALELQYIEAGLAKEQQSKENTTYWQRMKPFFTNYRYWLLVYWYMTMSAMYWGLVSWLPVYLKTARGFTWEEMGWLASLPFILTVITKAVNGWLNDRTGKCAPFLLAALFCGAVFIYLAATVPGKYPSALLLACAFGTTSMATSVAWTLLQKLVQSNTVTTAAGVMNGISQFMSAIMPVLIGFVIGVTGSYASGLFVLVGAGLIASGAAAVLAYQKY